MTFLFSDKEIRLNWKHRLSIRQDHHPITNRVKLFRNSASHKPCERNRRPTLMLSCLPHCQMTSPASAKHAIFEEHPLPGTKGAGPIFAVILECFGLRTGQLLLPFALHSFADSSALGFLGFRYLFWHPGSLLVRTGA